MDLSFTTYGYRVYYLPVVCISILPIKKHFERIVLTLDDDESKIKIFFSKSVLRLFFGKKARILIGASMGPHSKYFHYIDELWNNNNFILIDDDCFYTNPFWRFVKYCKFRSPEQIIAKRTLVVPRESLLDYSKFYPNQLNKTQNSLFVTNVGGAYYTKNFGAILKRNLGKHIGLCDKADDVWFFYLQIKNNIIPQQYKNFYNPLSLPGSQKKALYKLNTVKDYNSRQLRKTFNEDPISA